MKKKKKDLVNSFNSLADSLNTLAEQVAAISTFPPRGDGAREAVESEVNDLVKTIHSKLNSVHAQLKNKIWEDR